MPDSLVKSLPSSTSAFAGSQAAQHSVSDLAWACTGVTGASASTAQLVRIVVKADFHLMRFLHRCSSGWTGCNCFFRPTLVVSNTAARDPRSAISAEDAWYLLFSLVKNI